MNNSPEAKIDHFVEFEDNSSDFLHNKVKIDYRDKEFYSTPNAKFGSP